MSSRVRLATLVSKVAFRNPAHLAKIAPCVELISRGRLTLGIGAGWFAEEYRRYGWEFPPRPAVRIRQMEEAVRLIIGMWTEQRTTFNGKYFHTQDAILEPKPTPRPPRHRERSEASSISGGPGDCFAALAMTAGAPLLTMMEAGGHFVPT